MSRLNFQGIGNFGVNVKLRLLRSEQHHFGAAILLQLGIPVGNEARNFAGEPGVSLWPSIALEWRPIRQFRLDINFGYRHVFGSGSILTPAGGSQTGVTYAPPLTAGLGMSFRLTPALDLV